MIPVVSFYTENTPYKAEAMQMKKSALAVGFSDVNLFKVSNRGTWGRNCQQKVEILLKACDIIQEPFVYVDADARFIRPPYLFRGHLINCFDLALHYFKQDELLSGTIWINPTDRTRHILNVWQRLCVERPGVWDQRLLAEVLEDNADHVDVFKLPPEYTWIFDLSPLYYGENLEPCIVHYQASRKYKNLVRRNDVKGK